MMNTKIDIFLYPFQNEYGMEAYGVDVYVADQSATVEDLMCALDAFAAENIADCKGCDGCCHERAPLIAADIPALATLLPETATPAHAVCSAFADLTVFKNGATDITLRRHENSACRFLDQTQRICTQWPKRPFVCRSHFCMPRSPRLEQLRQDIVNMGENEFTRLLLAENSIVKEPFSSLSRVDAADYPENGQSGKQTYAEILLKDCVDEVFWQMLCTDPRP